jgi:hypothetical protein
MFKKDPDDKLAFDSLIIREGSFEACVDGQASIKLVINYFNSADPYPRSYGKVTVDNSVLSQETLNLFKEFVFSAEKDFGKDAFRSGGVVTPGSYSGVESTKGLGGR